MNSNPEIFKAKEAVSDTLNRLFTATDNLDWDSVRDCFAMEVRFDMTSMGEEEAVTLSPSQITDAWDDGLSSLDAIHHQTGNLKIDIDGDEAEAFCNGIAIHYKDVLGEESTRTFVGTYDFHLVNTVEGWKIDLFKFNLKFIQGNKNL